MSWEVSVPTQRRRFVKGSCQPSQICLQALVQTQHALTIFKIGVGPAPSLTSPASESILLLGRTPVLACAFHSQECVFTRLSPHTPSRPRPGISGLAQCLAHAGYFINIRCSE